MDATELDHLWNVAVEGAKQRIVDGVLMAPTYLLVGYDDALAEVNTRHIPQALATRIVELLAIANDAQALMVVAEAWMVALPISQPTPSGLRPSQSPERQSALFVSQVAKMGDTGGRVTRTQVWRIERDAAGTVTISESIEGPSVPINERIGDLLPRTRPSPEMRATAMETLNALRSRQSQTVH